MTNNKRSASELSIALNIEMRAGTWLEEKVDIGMPEAMQDSCFDDELLAFLLDACPPSASNDYRPKQSTTTTNQ